MEDTKSSACHKSEPPVASGHNPLEDISTYKVGGRTFIVEPLFKKSGDETIGTILLRLMKSDSEKIR